MRGLGRGQRRRRRRGGRAGRQQEGDGPHLRLLVGAVHSLMRVPRRSARPPGPCARRTRPERGAPPPRRGEGRVEEPARYLTEVACPRDRRPGLRRGHQSADLSCDCVE